MKEIEAENLLTPITLDDPVSIPDAVVHGTFYGAWERVLASGGLKSMKRNHVHFATGPSLNEVLSDDGGDDGPAEKQKGAMREVLGKNKVISGMRSDAQILIYVDIRKALHEEREMKWWRSENGVILTEGVESMTAEGAKGDRLVPTKYWIAAVEIKEGLGLLWKQGEGVGGVVKELPEDLRSRALPRGKDGGQGHGRGQRGKPRGRGTRTMKSDEG
jgi:2'-phosphotransferase